VRRYGRTGEGQWMIGAADARRFLSIQRGRQVV